MEYIQCSHCQKKYRVNDQVRAAVGRMVSCKDCGHPIEIVIIDSADEKKDQVENAAVEKDPDTAPDTEPKASIPSEGATSRASIAKASASLPPEKKRPKKLTISAVLGIVIVAASVYVFYQGRNEQMTVLADSAAHQAEVTEEAPRDEPLSPAEPEEKQVTTVDGQPKPFSDSCKQIAASQWLIDYSMTHGTPKSDAYMHMLDQSVSNNAEIRKRCGAARVVSEIVKTAQKGVPPEWLIQQINEMTMVNRDNMPHF